MSDIETIARFHEACKGICFLATCEGDRPRLRPMSPLAVEGKIVWVAAAADSPKMAQIAANPNVELCYLAPDHDHLRLRGTAEACGDPAVKKRMWDSYPLMHRYFQGPDDPQYALLRITVTEAMAMRAMSLEYQRLEL
ncbi:MAG TPA: pyridoxamine 5'-phosphate oxidase family protein [Phycisphaerae bacterium]|nr:pyridoxamine 5'-phosphate oxidase family protein [Phycisphaerae bacterium]